MQHPVSNRWKHQWQFHAFWSGAVFTLGGNYSTADRGAYANYANGFNDGRAVDVFNFDPVNYDDLGSGLKFSEVEKDVDEQFGAYFTFRVTPIAKLHLASGVRFSYSKNTFQGFGYCIPLYVTYEICTEEQIGEKLYFDEGGNSSTSDITWPPTVSVMYDVTDTLHVYSSYTDIYQDQRFYLDTEGNPLKPLTGVNIEAGLKWSSSDGRLNASLSAYRIQQKNYPILVSGPEYDSTFTKTCCWSATSNRINESKGAEFEINGEIARGLQISASYTFNENQIKGSDAGSDEGKALVSRAPKHLFKLWAGYQFADHAELAGLSFGWG